MSKAIDMALGMLWGWMPCGLSTQLLIAAWLQASAWHGALTMLAFGLATFAVMVPLTWAGARIGQRLQRGGWRTASGVLVLFAGLATLAGPWLVHMAHRFETFSEGFSAWAVFWGETTSR